jgi:ComEC/Rec2-related protein
VKHPLVIPTLLYVGGILLGNWLPLPLLWLFVGSFGAAGLVLSGPRGRDWALGALLVGAGWTNQVRHTAVLAPQDLRLQFPEPALVTVRGRLTETPYQRVFNRGEEETWHTLAQVEVTSIRRQRQVWQPASGSVAVSTPGILPNRFCGGREVEIVGVLQPPAALVAPGAFDYRTYLRRQGIYFQLRTLSPNDWQLASPEPGRAPQVSVADRFSAWAQRTLAHGLPEEDEPLRLLWTMTLGWKAGLNNEISQPFMKSGTIHIFAISGLHIALIAGMLVALLRVLQVPRSVCGVLVIPLIWFYTGVTGWQASAIRSTVMMTIIIFGWSLQRPSDLLNSLAAAAFLILLWDPQQLFQASFQLSFCCVLSLGLFARRFQQIGRGWLAPDPLLPDELRPRWQRWLRKPLYWLAASLATSLAACLGSLPLIAYYFNLFNPVSLLANVLIVPLSSFALMSSLASLVVGAWAPALCELFNHAAWFFMWLMIRASEWFAGLPGAWCYVRAPSPLQFALYYATLISLTAGWLTRPRLRGWVGGGVALLALAGVGQWLWLRPEMRLTVLPLRGGHAVFCDAPQATDVFLRDCGDASASQFVTQPFLKHEAVNRLPAFILSHGDVRQMGGATNILRDFPPRQVVTSPLRFRSPNYRSLLAGLDAGRPPHRVVQRGDRLGRWQVLHPDVGDSFSQADDGALVLRGDFDGVRILLLSDLGRRGQELLRQRHPDLRADIMVTGLPTQGEPLHESLVKQFQPRLIILADSEFPATRRAPPILRERLAAVGVPTLYTRETGAVQIRLRSGKFVAVNASGQVLAGN